eukprot:TRINITY_DN2599_c0_g1_i1.p1 TRINITY_DN2599_c0_g1~~TRINITY_DN2599_c0_g1_i1.p1  ORF type:complete len:461 (-),score=38.86 TRINITY_DN2599_c0_g1_i1:115-1497(-)
MSVNMDGKTSNDEERRKQSLLSLVSCQSSDVDALLLQECDRKKSYTANQIAEWLGKDWVSGSFDFAHPDTCVLINTKRVTLKAPWEFDLFPSAGPSETAQDDLLDAWFPVFLNLILINLQTVVKSIERNGKALSWFKNSEFYTHHEKAYLRIAEHRRSLYSFENAIKACTYAIQACKTYGDTFAKLGTTFQTIAEKEIQFAKYDHTLDLVDFFAAIVTLLSMAQSAYDNPSRQKFLIFYVLMELQLQHYIKKWLSMTIVSYEDSDTVLVSYHGINHKMGGVSSMQNTESSKLESKSAYKCRIYLLEQVFKLLDKNLKSADMEKAQVIVGGDFNLDLSDVKLSGWTVVEPEDPRDNSIDWFVTKNVLRFSAAAHHCIHDSDLGYSFDHYPISLQFQYSYSVDHQNERKLFESAMCNHKESWCESEKHDGNQSGNTDDEERQSAGESLYLIGTLIKAWMDTN